MKKYRSGFNWGLGRNKNVKIPFWIWNSCFKCSMISEYVTKTKISLKYTRFEELRETWLGFDWLTGFCNPVPILFPMCLPQSFSLAKPSPHDFSIQESPVRKEKGVEKPVLRRIVPDTSKPCRSQCTTLVFFFFFFYNLILQNNIRLFTNDLQITFWNIKPLICGSSLLSKILILD